MYATGLSSLKGRTADATTLAEAREAAENGFARVPYDVVAGAGEDELAKSAMSVRCIQRADGSVPLSEDEPDLYAIVARSY
jgi:prolyl-tRNA synthetase